MPSEATAEGKNTKASKTTLNAGIAEADRNKEDLHFEIELIHANAFSTMDSIRAAVYLSICLSLLCVCRGQMSTDNTLSSQEEQFIKRDLVEALEELLDGEQDSRLSVEKKASVIPRCDVGERCAMKHGPRIGRLCDCMRGTACNTFFLRCY